MARPGKSFPYVQMMDICIFIYNVSVDQKFLLMVIIMVLMYFENMVQAWPIRLFRLYSSCRLIPGRVAMVESSPREKEENLILCSVLVCAVHWTFTPWKEVFCY